MAPDNGDNGACDRDVAEAAHKGAGDCVLRDGSPLDIVDRHRLLARHQNLSRNPVRDEQLLGPLDEGGRKGLAPRGGDGEGVLPEGKSP